MGKAFKILGFVAVIGASYKVGEVVGAVKGFKGSFDVLKAVAEGIAEGANDLKITINGSEITLKSKEKEDEEDEHDS